MNIPRGWNEVGHGWAYRGSVLSLFADVHAGRLRIWSECPAHKHIRGVTKGQAAMVGVLATFYGQYGRLPTPAEIVALPEPEQT